MTKEFKIYEYDIVYLSYDEPNAQANWEDLLKKFPQAKWVNGVKGSENAYKKINYYNFKNKIKFIRL